MPGDGWEVVAQTLLQEGGLRRRAGIDELGLALVAGCNGSQTVGRLLDVLASAYEIDTDDLREESLPLVRGLVQDGYLLLP